jgi:hypothetical protein
VSTDDPERERDAREEAAPADPWYRGVITRVYYGSESGTLVSKATGREYAFKGQFVQIIGPIPRIDGLREGMEVGFDLAWTARGRRVSVIRVFD